VWHWQSAEAGPRCRAWNTSFEARNPDGDVVRVDYHLQEVTGDVVRFTETLSGRWWHGPQVEHGVLRFLDTDLLTVFLHDAGFAIEQQFGDWNRAPLTDASDEIITIARRT